ncbi:MAG: (2Fe-2S)-binding protein [Alphaproteobacteria bacterium]
MTRLFLEVIKPAKPVNAAALPPSNPDEMICGCFNLTLRDLQTFLRANPDAGFDEMMWRTKAGTKCTACTLDLEYHYVATVREERGADIHKRAPVGIDRPALSGKAALYKIMDGISPDVAQPFINVMPVLTGCGIDEFVCIDNHSLLYEGKVCAPDMRVDLEVRDAEGRLRFRYDDLVRPETAIRVAVSEHLPETKDGLGIGSVTIGRRAVQSGFRGTTRPQIEIVAPAAACALHSQAASRAPEGWFTCLFRPDDERIFFTAVSADDQEQTIEFTYPAPDPSHDWSCPESHVISLPPRGARLHELALPRKRFEHLIGRPIQVRWRASGWHKVHAVCATPSLDRFSIDHL